MSSLTIPTPAAVVAACYPTLSEQALVGMAKAIGRKLNKIEVAFLAAVLSDEDVLPHVWTQLYTAAR